MLKRILTYLSIVLIGLMIVNKAVYFHSHILEDGQIIEHAHPFNKSTDNSDKPVNHSHTNFELLILSQLTVLFAFGIALILFFCRSLKINRQMQKIEVYTPMCVSFYSLRGPPCCLASQ